MLYDKAEGFQLSRIERDAGVKFERRGTPQPEEIMEASAVKPQILDPKPKIVHR